MALGKHLQPCQIWFIVALRSASQKAWWYKFCNQICGQFLCPKETLPKRMKKVNLFSKLNLSFELADKVDAPVNGDSSSQYSSSGLSLEWRFHKYDCWNRHISKGRITFYLSWNWVTCRTTENLSIRLEHLIYRTFVSSKANGIRFAKGWDTHSMVDLSVNHSNR